MVQAVILFGSETWVLTAVMIQNLEGLSVGFLRKVMGGKEQRLGDDIYGNYRVITLFHRGNGNLTLR